MKSQNRKARIAEIKERVPNAFASFELVLSKYGRKDQPWLPFYGFEDESITWGLSGEEKDGYRLLVFWFRHKVFDALCEQITEKDGTYYDTWGPDYLPSYSEFFDGLSPIEQQEFREYVEERKLRTLDVETSYSRSEVSMDIVRLALREVASDARAQFRCIASLVEYETPHVRGRFSDTQWAELVGKYGNLKKRFSQIIGLAPYLNFLSPLPIKWKGTKVELVAVMDALIHAGLMEARDEQVIGHFDFDTKYQSSTPIKRYSGSRSELKKGESYVDSVRFEKLLKELKSHLQP